MRWVTQTESSTLSSTCSPRTTLKWQNLSTVNPTLPLPWRKNFEKRQGNNEPGMLPFCCSSYLILLPVDQLNHRYDNPYSQSPSTTANLFLFQPPPSQFNGSKRGVKIAHKHNRTCTVFGRMTLIAHKYSLLVIKIV